MTKPSDERPKRGSSDPELGDLSARLKDLSGRIAAERSEQAESTKPPVSVTDASDYARGYRLVSEFVAGTLVGGLIGYGIDWLFGTLPFGLIIFLLLGFGAGILNLARAAKRVPPAQERLSSTPPPPAALDDDDDEED
jgi:ATP synthase protein I